jgi:hypothetical protein
VQLSDRERWEAHRRKKRKSYVTVGRLLKIGMSQRKIATRLSMTRKEVSIARDILREGRLHNFATKSWRRFSDEEILFLRDALAQKWTAAEVGSQLNRNPICIRTKWQALGLLHASPRRGPQGAHRLWLPEEDKVLVLTAKEPAAVTARLLGRSNYSVLGRRRRLELTNSSSDPDAPMAFEKWLPMEDAVLFARCGQDPVVVASHLGRSVLAVQMRARRLGIRWMWNTVKRSGQNIVGFRLLAARRKGLTTRQLAERTGSSIESVRRRIRRAARAI